MFLHPFNPLSCSVTISDPFFLQTFLFYQPWAPQALACSLWYTGYTTRSCTSRMRPRVCWRKSVVVKLTGRTGQGRTKMRMTLTPWQQHPLRQHHQQPHQQVSASLAVLQDIHSNHQADYLTHLCTVCLFFRRFVTLGMSGVSYLHWDLTCGDSFPYTQKVLWSNYV